MSAERRRMYASKGCFCKNKKVQVSYRMMACRGYRHFYRVYILTGKFLKGSEPFARVYIFRDNTYLIDANQQT